jgi:hypothetical protein
MRWTVIKILGWCICAVIVMAGACPTPIEPLPPVLNAPSFLTKKVTWAKVTTNSFAEVVSLSWKKSDADTIPTGSFTILRKIGSQSTYTAAMRGIPASISDYADPISQFGFSKEVIYRIFAVDTLNRSGDTSLPCTLTLAQQVILREPADTLTANYFSWDVLGQMVMGGFTCTFAFADTAAVRWQAPPTVLTFIGENTLLTLTQALPDTLWPLPRGRYFWSVRLDISGGANPQSIIVGTCHVP